MTVLHEQIGLVRARMNRLRWRQRLPGYLAAAWIVALVAIALPKAFVLPLPANVLAAWPWLGLVTATGIGLVAATVSVWRRRVTDFEAAAKIDRELNLRELTATAWMLSQQPSPTVPQRIVIDDANQRLTGLDLHDVVVARRSRLRWLAGLPLVLGLAAAWGLPDAQPLQPPATLAALDSQITPTQIESTAETLREDLEERRKLAEELGLEEAAELFARLEAEARDLENGEQIDKREALIQLNDVKEQLEQRAQQLGDPDSIREALGDVGSFDAGPAKDLLDSMQAGDFAQAAQEFEQLAEKLAQEGLSPAETQALQSQLEQLAQQIKERQKEREAQRQALEQQLEQALQQGDSDRAAEIQEQLRQLQQQQATDNALNQLAQQLDQAAQDMASAANSQGDSATAQAQQQLRQLAQQMQQMQQDADELETLEGALTQVGQCKGELSQEGDANFASSASSSASQGSASAQGGQDGAQSGQGSMSSLAQGGQGQGQQSGSGMGQGQGSGARPEEQSDGNFYDSRVAADPQAGEVVMTGKVSGPNRAGQSRAEVQRAIEAALANDVDPLGEQRLPRSKRNQVKEYFERVRSGNQ